MTHVQKRISIIICTYKRLSLAARLASHPEFRHKNVETIIVNQGKNLTLLSVPKACRIIHTSKINLPAARNIGIRQATGDVIIFLDDDTLPAKGFIKAHQSAYRQNNILGVAGRVINSGEMLPANMRLITGKINKYGTQFTQAFFSTKKQRVDFPYGCNMSFRKDILTKVGMFDENYLPPLSAFEEIDIALRVKKHGSIVFEPNALAFHKKAKRGGTRVGEKEREKSYWFSYGYFLAINISISSAPIAYSAGIKHALIESPVSLFSFALGILKAYSINTRNLYREIKKSFTSPFVMKSALTQSAG